MEKNLEELCESLYGQSQDIRVTQEIIDLILEEILEEVFFIPAPNAKKYENKFKQYQTKLFVVIDYMQKLGQEIQKLDKQAEKINHYLLHRLKINQINPK